MTNKNIFIIIALAVLALAIFFYIIGSNSDIIDNNKNIEEAVGNQDIATSTINLSAQPGIIGEGAVVDIEDITVSSVLPKDIFSTTGIVLEIKEDAIIIQSDGHSFADGIGRELTCLTQDSMFVIDKNKVKHQGIDSLNALEIGDEILIKSTENIRGKIEFTIKSIKILN